MLKTLESELTRGRTGDCKPTCGAERTIWGGVGLFPHSVPPPWSPVLTAGRYRPSSHPAAEGREKQAFSDTGSQDASWDQVLKLVEGLSSLALSNAVSMEMKCISPITQVVTTKLSSCAEEETPDHTGLGKRCSAVLMGRTASVGSVFGCTSQFRDLAFTGQGLATRWAGLTWAKGSPGLKALDGERWSLLPPPAGQKPGFHHCSLSLGTSSVLESLSGICFLATGPLQSSLGVPDTGSHGLQLLRRSAPRNCPCWSLNNARPKDGFRNPDTGY